MLEPDLPKVSTMYRHLLQMACRSFYRNGALNLCQLSGTPLCSPCPIYEDFPAARSGIKG